MTRPLSGTPLLALTVSLCVAAACQGPDLEDFVKENASRFAPPDQSWHQGPEVDLDGTGPARYVGALMEAYDAERAMETVRFTDGFYREPANHGYEAVIDHLISRLRAAGFGGDDGRFTLDVVRSPLDKPAWTPRAGHLALVEDSGAEIVLHAFDQPADHDRTMLPAGAPACDLEGPIRFSLDELEPGDILVTEARLSQVGSRAAQRGAIAVLSASLYPFNVDPTGAERHMAAMQYTSIPDKLGLPAAQISPLSYLRLEGAGTGARVRFRAEVDLREGATLRTLVARIHGDGKAEECVTSAAHVQEPGANDNASGVGGLLEGAVSLAAALRNGTVDWPQRSLVFVWGDEFDQTERWIEWTDLTPIAGISSDMVGQSQALTGSRALLERGPDPGAIAPRLPDEHTPWGAGRVTEEDLHPNGLAVIARCALVDVGLASGGWESADHPWEGGSDHDVFLDRQIPAVLFWHFTDFAYHTSLDRLDMVDPDEIERTEVAVLATMLAVADPRPEDTRRYVVSAELERLVRTAAAREAGDDENADAWDEWSNGATAWLRALCMDIPLEEAAVKPR